MWISEYATKAVDCTWHDKYIIRIGHSSIYSMSMTEVIATYFVVYLDGNNAKKSIKFPLMLTLRTRARAQLPPPYESGNWHGATSSMSHQLWSTTSTIDSGGPCGCEWIARMITPRSHNTTTDLEAQVVVSQSSTLLIPYSRISKNCSLLPQLKCLEWTLLGRGEWWFLPVSLVRLDQLASYTIGVIQ